MGFWRLETPYSPGGVALVNMLSLLVIAPVVAFYLLRDWDRMVAHVVDLLPHRHSQTIQSLRKKPIALSLDLYEGRRLYALLLDFCAIGLSFVGLDLGLVVGWGPG